MDMIDGFKVPENLMTLGVLNPEFFVLLQLHSSFQKSIGSNEPIEPTITRALLAMAIILNVPFPPTDFMDALCDPRAFLSAQEKRAEQLKALGIEENDISGDVIQSKGDAGGKGGDASGKGGKDGKKEEKKGKLIRIQMISY